MTEARLRMMHRCASTQMPLCTGASRRESVVRARCSVRSGALKGRRELLGAHSERVPSVRALRAKNGRSGAATTSCPFVPGCSKRFIVDDVAEAAVAV